MNHAVRPSLAGLALLAACAPEAQKLPPAGPAEVVCVELQPQTVDLAARNVAQTRANNRVEIRARVAGELIAVGFADGDLVKKDQALFTLDRRPFEAALAAASAQKAQAVAKRDEAQRTVERKQRLVAADAAAQRELDDSKTTLLAAQAALDAATAAEDKAKLDLDYTTLRAPFDGRIGKRLRDVGALIDAGQNSLLAVVQQIDPIQVVFRFSEREMLAWKRGLADGTLTMDGGRSALQVRVSTLDGAEHPATGEVSFLGMEVDPATGAVEIDARLANPGEKLVPGQFVTATLSGVKRPATLVVPQRAVSIGAEGAS
ncbi:MAG: efflux RND transporter periplasmic adaptor subunit, partial [Planctomycetes bacterium]|nr:efflux RND transporter periplasmic adaptor subunit [Planctomycetota bacterium]